MRDNVINFPNAIAARSHALNGTSEGRAEKTTALTSAQFKVAYRNLPWEAKREIAAEIEARINARQRARAQPAEVERQISRGLKGRVPKPSLQEQRDARRDAWRKADTRTDYFWAVIRWCEQVHIAQREGIEEALRFGGKRFALDGALRKSAIRKYREALNLQLLTPAPDLAAVKWKRSNFEGSIGLDLRTIERAIADDLAWLAKYPASQRRVRRSPE